MALSITLQLPQLPYPETTDSKLGDNWKDLLDTNLAFSTAVAPQLIHVSLWCGSAWESHLWEVVPHVIQTFQI